MITPAVTDPTKIPAMRGAMMPAQSPTSHPTPVATKATPAATPAPATTQPTPAPAPPAVGATTTPDALSWANFQSGLQQASQDPNWHAPPMDEATWNAMSPQQRYDFVQANGVSTPGPGGWLLADQNQTAAYTQQFGAAQGQLVFGYGDPTQYGKGINDWAIDPSKILRLPDGSWVMDSANVDQNKWNALQAQDNKGYLNPATGIGLVLGAGLIGDFGFGLNGFGGAPPVDVPPPIDPITAPPIPDVAPPPNVLADTLTPGINNAIDTSLLPSVTPPPGDFSVGAPPDITPPPADAFPPTTPDFPVNLQPPPNIPEIPPPDFNITPGSDPSLLDRFSNTLTKDPLRTVGTALSVGNLLHNKPGSVPQSLQNTVNANGPLADQARNTLTNQGAPTPDQMSVIDATIEQQRKQGEEAIKQSAINAGQGGSSSMVTQDKIRAFGEQLATMRMQLIQKQAEQNVLQAMQELGMVTQEQFQLAQLELQQDNAAQQRAASIMQSLGWLWSGASGKTTSTTTTTTGGP